MTDETTAAQEEAACWVVRLNSDQRTRADETAFRAWLERDPAHADAYADCAALWDGVADLVATDEAHETLRPLRAPVRSPRILGRRNLIFGGVGAAIAAGVAGLVGPLVLNGEQTFYTKRGEQRRVRLADGSGVLLNTDTRLRVRLVGTERRLFLDRGQAFFQVAKDKARPFRVFAGPNEIRALGTAFEVRRIGDRVQVTLEEGKVAIYRHGDAAQPLMTAAPLRNAAADGSPPGSRALAGAAQPEAVLLPGDQADLASARSAAVRRVDLRKVQAWRYGRMILDDAPLGETVADLNRYGGVQIVLADPKLADIRISGFFHTGRPDDFVESVTAAFPVEVERQDDKTIVLKSR